ncbi:MAG: ABC transporter permease [Planctomycetota bacterium]|jgi:ribose transport system permease protein|nr:ABC transporter permease [Planctomycetota bacterium]
MLAKLFRKNESIALGLCLILVVVLTFASGVFWTQSNLNSLQASISPTAIMAFGMMILLICGYFDLSIGSIMLLVGILAGRLSQLGLNTPSIIVLVLLAGLAVGCLNGFLVAILKINALIATIGVQYIGYGLAMTMWDKEMQHRKFPANFIALGEDRFFGLYYMTWIMLALLLVFTFFLRYTAAGRRLYFVGGNREAARLIGFNDRRIVFLCYACTGLLAAVAGVLAVARIQSPTQYLGGGIHMTCMIACVIGGGSFAGGRGIALGAFLGVSFMSLLTNMFNLLEMNTQLQNVVVGVTLVAVIVIDGYVTLKKMRAMGKI